MRPILLLLALLPVSTFAQDLTIDAPESVSPGSLVVFDAIDFPAKTFQWKAVNPPTADCWKVGRDGSQLFFATPQPGTYWFVLSFTTDDPEPQIVILTHALTVEGDVPGPNPQPQPGPKPVIPDGKYGLAKQSYELAATIPGQPKIQELLTVYRSLSSQIRAGSIKGIPKILETTREKLMTQLGDTFDAWKPWGQAIAKTMTKAETDGLLKTEEDLATAYDEIAVGLEILSAMKKP